MAARRGRARVSERDGARSRGQVTVAGSPLELSGERQDLRPRSARGPGRVRLEVCPAAPGALLSPPSSGDTCGLAHPSARPPSAEPGTGHGLKPLDIEFMKHLLEKVSPH